MEINKNLNYFKYLKYKNKYFDLLNKVGGNFNLPQDLTGLFKDLLQFIIQDQYLEVDILINVCLYLLEII